eukprot:8203247-Pyramimonas_sp.AAC.1
MDRQNTARTQSEPAHPVHNRGNIFSGARYLIRRKPAWTSAVSVLKVAAHQNVGDLGLASDSQE